MYTVTVSAKYQIVIPKKIRENHKIKPGQKLQVIDFMDRIVFIPAKNIMEMRGFLKDINTDIDRENDCI